jgi:hypothetical protein
MGVVTSAITGAVRSLIPDVADTSGLLLLVVRPLFRSGETAVGIELSANAAGEGEGDDPTLQPWELPFAAFQVKNEDAAPSGSEIPALCVPVELISGLQYRLASHPVRQSKPLWLKLARPYGLLGIAPWEKALGAALARPVLRIPDFPDRPVERADVLESVMILDAGPDDDPADVARRATQVAQAVLKGSSRPTTRVHVFASARLYRAAREIMADQRITIYDPAGAKTSAVAASTQETGAMPLRSYAWVDWVRQSIGDRCLDAVHMVTRAKWSESGAYLMVAASPSPEEMQAALVLVEADEFGLLVNRVGAWAVTFTPPSAGCRNDVAFFADRFAHLRTGTVLFNSGQGPEDLEPLQASCQVLFSAKPSPAPALRNGFLCCHPGFVRGETQPDAGRLLALLAGQASLLAERSPLADRLLRTATRLVPGIATRELSGPPVWMAAIQRFLEEAALEAARRAGKDVLLSNVRPGSKSADQQLSAPSEQTKATLAAIQRVLENYNNQKVGS